MNKKALSPWVLPTVGATSAVGAGLLGGINIDEWESMKAEEKAKKLLKCLVMGGVVGLGAEGVRQGYNIIKKRALEKPASYKKSLLSYMLKQALNETPQTGTEGTTDNTRSKDDLPEEASWGDSTIFGIPTHLAIGGGLGLAGGLTLYHFLTEQKKKKPTGYIGAGLGGLLTGVLGAGLFKGWSADEQKVKSDLFKPKTPPQNQQASNQWKPPLSTDIDIFVGDPNRKLTPEQAQSIAIADRNYFANKRQYDLVQAERLAREAYRAAIPELDDDSILRHLRYINELSEYKPEILDATENDMRNTYQYPENTITGYKNELAELRHKYNTQQLLPSFNLQNLDTNFVNWYRNNTDNPKLIQAIFNHYYPNERIPYNIDPLAYLSQNSNRFNNPYMLRDINNAGQNLFDRYNYEYNYTTPGGDTFDTTQRVAQLENNYRPLTWKYYPRDKFLSNIIPTFRDTVYFPDDYTPSENVKVLVGQLHHLYASETDPTILQQKERVIKDKICEEILKSNGLPTSAFVPDIVQNSPTDMLVNGHQYSVEGPPKYMSEREALSHEDIPILTNLDRKDVVRALHSSGVDLSNLTWRPIQNRPEDIAVGAPFAKAYIGNDLYIQAYKGTSVPGSATSNIHFNIVVDEQNLEKRIKGEQVLPEGVSINSPGTLGPNTFVYTTNDGGALAMNLSNGDLTYTPSVFTQIINAATAQNKIPPTVQPLINQTEIRKIQNNNIIIIPLSNGGYISFPTNSDNINDVEYHAPRIVNVP